MLLLPWSVHPTRGECYGVYVCIPDRVIITDGDGMRPCTRVHVVGCLPASACLYHRRVMNARPEAVVLAMFI
jgi:hypothetical protein